jgi:hypothetical protein
MMKQIVTFLLLIFIVSSCKTKDSDSATSKVSMALSLAGENKAELRKVIDHYTAMGDSQKLAAAHFLIANMPEKKYINYTPYDSLGNVINYDLFSYPTSDAIHAAKKKIEDSLKRTFRYLPSAKVEDIKSIKADYLIENIDYAFKAWQMPWARHLSFDEFCEYLLPYRFGSEPLESWRKQLFNQMQWVLDSAKKDASVLRLCQIINDSIKKAFAYKHYELDFFPGVLSYTEAKKIKGGHCDDLNMVGAYWMRSIGIPVACEFTPIWANSNFGGHSWLTVLTEDKKNIPFNPAYDNPYADSLPFKDSRICKVYRKVFANKPIKFAQIHGNIKSPPKYLQEDNFIDATHQIIPITNCTIPVQSNSPVQNQFAYIGVLCGYGWQAVDTVVLSETKMMAHNIGRHTIYNTFTISNDSAKTFSYLSNPFLIDDNGQTIPLVPDQRAFDQFSINIKKSYWWLRKDRHYTLTVWKNNRWENIGTPLKWTGKKWAPMNNDPLIISTNDSIVTFNKVARNSLLRLQNIEPIDDIGSYGRPFLISNSKVVTY